MRGGRILRERLDELPERLAHWPAGLLREVLCRTAGPRELVPIAMLQGTREHFSVLNGDDEKISALSIDDWYVCRGSQRLEDSPKRRVLLLPLKGWEKETEDAAGALGEAGIRPASRTLLESALFRLGRRPLDYSSKLYIDLSAAPDAVGAVRLILLDLLATMRANESGTKRAIDTEFLHDFRARRSGRRSSN